MTITENYVTLYWTARRQNYLSGVTYFSEGLVGYLEGEGFLTESYLGVSFLLFTYRL